MTEAERVQNLIAELQDQICILPNGCSDPKCQELVEQVAILNEVLL